MAEWVAKLGTTTGQVIERTYLGDSEDDVRRELETQDFMVYSVRRKAAVSSLLGGRGLRRKKISAKEFLIFNQELASLITAGLPIISSLDILIERRKQGAFRAALSDIRDQVKSGAALSDAFASQGDLFPRLFSSSLASGERSGEIAAVLKRYIAYTKTVLTLRKKIVGAMIYPTILICMSVLLVAVLVIFILPNFQALFADMGTELPFLTQALLSVSGFVTHYILVIVPGVLIAGLGIMSYMRSETGALAWDGYKMRIPLVGRIFAMYGVSRFCRTLGTLVQGGIPLVTAIEISARAVGNRLYEKEMLVVARKVREGQPLWDSLEKSGLISDMAVGMIKVGESTGSLEEMLTNVATFYDDEIETSLATMISLLEPAMLIFMGLIVVVMLLSIYLPLIQSYTASNY